MTSSFHRQVTQAGAQTLPGNHTQPKALSKNQRP
jgi:hypothetical protein